MKAGWKTFDETRAIGIAKDGRVIYSPLAKGTGEAGDGGVEGKAAEDCAQDICNGREEKYVYSYRTTFFHPYTLGCFGPGAYPELM